VIYLHIYIYVLLHSLSQPTHLSSFPNAHSLTLLPTYIFICIDMYIFTDTFSSSPFLHQPTTHPAKHKHTHTHKHTYIYIYLCMYILFSFPSLHHPSCKKMEKKRPCSVQTRAICKIYTCVPYPFGFFSGE